MKHEAFILVMLHNAECAMRGAVPAVRVDWEAWLKRKPTEAEAVGLSRTLAALEARGMLRRLPQRLVILTKAGCERAMVLKEAVELVECMPKAAADGGMATVEGEPPVAQLDAGALDGIEMEASADPVAHTEEQTEPESVSRVEYDEVETCMEPECEPAAPDPVDDAPSSPPELTEADFGLPPSPLQPATVSPYERKPIRLSDLQRKKPERWTLLWYSNDP